VRARLWYLYEPIGIAQMRTWRYYSFVLALWSVFLFLVFFVLSDDGIPRSVFVLCALLSYGIGYAIVRWQSFHGKEGDELKGTGVESDEKYFLNVHHLTPIENKDLEGVGPSKSMYLASERRRNDIFY
jgi:hypothetical protein